MSAVSSTARPPVTQTFHYSDISTLYVSVETNVTITYHNGDDLIVNIAGDTKNVNNVSLNHESNRLVVTDDYGCNAKIEILAPRPLRTLNITTYRRGQVKIDGDTVTIEDITIDAMSESNVEVDCKLVQEVVITAQDNARVSVKRIGDKHAVSKNFGSTVILNGMKL